MFNLLLILFLKNDGFFHWFFQRLSAFCMLFLCCFFFESYYLFNFFLLFSYHHCFFGILTFFEDYIHIFLLRLLSFFFLKLFAMNYLKSIFILFF